MNKKISKNGKEKSKSIKGKKDKIEKNKEPLKKAVNRRDTKIFKNEIKSISKEFLINTFLYL